MTKVFILILSLSGSYKGAVVTQEFNSYENCLAAAGQFITRHKDNNSNHVWIKHVDFVCVEK